MSIHLRSLCVCACLTACTSYVPQPLPAGAPTNTRLEHVRVDTATLPFPQWRLHRFDVSDGLDSTEMAMLAVANNPDLKLARDDAALSHAQAFAAGLLPDPQLALGRDLSNTGGAGSAGAFNAGLGFDINALLSHANARDAAAADAHKADLNLLWQEWQVASRGRLLHVKLIQMDRVLAVLGENERSLGEQVRRGREALQHGLFSSDALAPHLAALQDVQRQLFELERQRGQSAHELNALLGLAPEAMVPLRDDDDATVVDEAAVRAALAMLPRRRPDLRAIEAAYMAQDLRYRGAILGQFPAINVGLTRARDAGGIYSNAVGVTLSLPFLNRNRGNIAIESATRQRLYDEYQLRLAQAGNEIEAILAERRLGREQLVRIDGALAQLRTAAERSALALHRGDVDALVEAGARSALMAKQVEQIGLQQSMLELDVALQTLLGVAPHTSSERGAQ